MPAHSITAEQLTLLRHAIDADVSRAVLDAAVRDRLLQLIDARFQQLHTDTENQQPAAVDGNSEQHETVHQDVSVEEVLPASSQQQQQQQQTSAAEEVNTQQPTSAIVVAGSNTKSGKRNKKGKAMRKEQQQEETLTSPPQPQSSSQSHHSQSQPTPSPTADRDIDLLSTTNVSVRLDHNDASGRLVRAVSPLSAGTRLLDDRGYAAAIKLEQCSEVCRLCHTIIKAAHNSDRTHSKLACSECRVAHYCSTRCQRIDASYAHPTECRMLAAVGQLSRRTSVDADLLQMLAAVCARHYRDEHRKKYLCSSDQTATSDSGCAEQH